MSSSTAKRRFWQGFRDGLPFVVIVAPFAAVFGVLATEAGLSVVETMGFSVLVIAGASQIAALQLMVDNAPTIIILATALAVNLRMAMYSASLVPHLGAAPFWTRAVIAYLTVDQSYVMAVSRYDADPSMSTSEKIRYFFGVIAPVATTWYVFTLVGALLGQQIPDGWALDFAVPIAFLAITAPMLKTVAHLAAALTSIVLALMLAWLPPGVGLLIAGLVAMIIGAEVERRMERAP
ncbi:MAG: AzlC family ABC transporter permease [Pseudomonadota bacterium]